MARKEHHGVVRSDGAAAVGDAGAREAHRPIGKEAKCRQFIADRLNSSQDYAKFAAAAGVDILIGGEPLVGFKVVNRLDETTLRHRDLELRREVFARLAGGQKAIEP